MMEYREIPMADIQPGDMLANQGTVTAVMRRGDTPTTDHPNPRPLDRDKVRVECGPYFAVTASARRLKVIGRESWDDVGGDAA